MSIHKTIDVICAVFPNGETLWFPAERGSEYLAKVVSAWKEQNPEYSILGVTMGAVEISMPLDAYNTINATNNFHWPEG
jgi:hypothetical protein